MVAVRIVRHGGCIEADWTDVRAGDAAGGTGDDDLHGLRLPSSARLEREGDG